MRVRRTPPLHRGPPSTLGGWPAQQAPLTQVEVERVDPAALARIAELERENDELRSQLRARDDFLAVASHELRSPATALGLQVQVLQRVLRQRTIVILTPAEIGAQLDLVQRQLKRFTALLDRLLDISRITAGQIILQPEPVDLVSLVRDCIAGLADDLRERACTVTVSAPSSVSGRWDRVRLEQVISNLLTNAFKYGPGQPVEVAVDASRSEARLKVRDHGMGIARENQARIFERFERAVPQQQFRGFGLGLWITRQILNAMGGTIAVSSRPGHGALFTVTLPRGGPSASTEGGPSGSVAR